MCTSLKWHIYKVIRKHLLSLKALLYFPGMVLFSLTVQKEGLST